LGEAQPLITVAIPAYNRPDEIGQLLDSILGQDFDSFDVLVVEDCSPREAEIRAVVEERARRFPQRRVRYVSNPKNHGYDGNLRRILELSEGTFTLFMGDDDLLRPGALARLGEVIRKHPQLGVILRGYDHVDLQTGERTEVFRYFDSDRFFPSGADTIRTFFRRSVAIAGFTIHTQSARALATAQFDGTLLYQLHLSANVLGTRDGYYVSDVLTSMRKNGQQRHFFGSAEAERGKFAPTALTAEHSLNFMRGMFEIARSVEERLQLGVYPAIVADIGNYSYAFLKLHAKSRRVFAGYVRELAKLGLWKNPYFWGYSGALMVLPSQVLDRGIVALKKLLPATPRLGKVYRGENP
jgi:abequosyltransferase